MESIFFLLRAQVFRWHKAFLDENVEDEFRSGSLAHKKTDKNPVDTEHYITTI